MTETFIALAFAHVLADFVLQTGWMVERKREPGVLLFHVALVLATAMVAIGRADAWELLVLAAAHLVIDAIKTHALPAHVGSFLADQAAHFVSIFAIAVISPDLWQTGMWWKMEATVLPAMLFAGGLILATRGGGFAIGILMKDHTESLPEEQESGLPRGGLTIGILERGLIFLLVQAGQPAAIGFLIAAKSILRFGTVQENRAASEYVIIGTLASFGWAIAVTYGAVWLADRLPFP